MLKAFIQWVKRTPHVWWTLLLPYVIAAYIVPEHIVTGAYASTAVALDGAIPFFAPAVLFYAAWFPFLVFCGLWLLLEDGTDFKRFMLGLALNMTLAGIVYVLWPNGQDLRPDLSQPANVFEWVLGGLYSLDTNTNVLPSLHVACALSTVACIWDTSTVRHRSTKLLLTLLGVLISVSTVFVKQHAVLDLAAGLVLGAIAAWLSFFLLPRLPRGKRRDREAEGWS